MGSISDVEQPERHRRARGFGALVRGTQSFSTPVDNFLKHTYGQSRSSCSSNSMTHSPAVMEVFECVQGQTLSLCHLNSVLTGRYRSEAGKETEVHPNKRVQFLDCLVENVSQYVLPRLPDTWGTGTDSLRPARFLKSAVKQPARLAPAASFLATRTAIQFISHQI